MNTLKTLFLISLTGTLLGYGMSADGGDVHSKYVAEHSQTVTFYDLDLAKPADARTLLHRIRTAAQQACNSNTDNPHELRANVDRIRCVTTSFRDTVAQVNKRFNTKLEKVAGKLEEQRNLISKY